jgi:hypothetical protein
VRTRWADADLEHVREAHAYRVGTTSWTRL